jgi:hypothetical protein
LVVKSLSKLWESFAELSSPFHPPPSNFERSLISGLYIRDVVGNLTLRARCEEYVEDEEWTPAENEGEEHQPQNLNEIELDSLASEAGRWLD